MVKIPKMDKDGEKYKRPFLSECSGKRHRERPYSPFVRIAISPSTKERKRENFKLFTGSGNRQKCSIIYIIDNDDMGFVAPLDFNSDSEIPRARDKERRESLNI